jgi:hypothetical protein
MGHKAHEFRHFPLPFLLISGDGQDKVNAEICP